MRIVLIGAKSTGLGAALAEHLHLDHVELPDEIATDGFVLEGAPRDLAEARALDALLHARAADVDVVLWLTGGPTGRLVESVLDHYRGRVVEIDPEGDLLASALDGLREAMLAA